MTLHLQELKLLQACTICQHFQSPLYGANRELERCHCIILVEVAETRNLGFAVCCTVSVVL